MDDIGYIAVLLFAFALQLSLCLLVKKVILRLLPLLLAILGNGFLLVMIFTTDAFWNLIGNLMLFAVGLCVLGACALAWGVFGVICLIRSSQKRNEAQPWDGAPPYDAK